MKENTSPQWQLIKEPNGPYKIARLHPLGSLIDGDPIHEEFLDFGPTRDYIHQELTMESSGTLEPSGWRVVLISPRVQEMVYPDVLIEDEVLQTLRREHPHAVLSTSEAERRELARLLRARRAKE